MSVRDKAKQANSVGGGQEYTKLDSQIYLRCKADNEGGYFEQITDDGSKIKIRTPIKGYVIGQALNLSGFHKASGDIVFSTPYLTNKKIAVFIKEKASQKTRFLAQGTRDEIEAAIFNAGIRNLSLKTRKLYYIATTTKDGAAIVCIETSLPLAISIHKKIGPDVLSDYFFIFEPTLFDRNANWDEDIRKTMAILWDPQNLTTNMGYTTLTQGDPFTEEAEAAIKKRGLDLEKELDHYLKWKSEQLGQTTEVIDQEPNYDTSQEITHTPENNHGYTGPSEIAEKHIEQPEGDEWGDLPF